MEALSMPLSILIGTGLGWWADGRLGSEPWGVVVGFGIGLAAFVRRLQRLRRAAEAGPAEHEESD
jgi:F0F1-type ATP synthase assembly protein I